jgi:L-alanine-DL-glutamate epimerase-like enolase superfamily enzyme
MMEPLNLTWFEEPVICHDHAGEAAIRAALDTPIASGETVYTIAASWACCKRVPPMS